MLELNKLYNMDCMQGMKEFPDGFFDLAIVDPPYGIGIDGQKKRVCGNPKHNRKEHIRKSWDKAIIGFPREALRRKKRRIYDDEAAFLQLLLRVVKLREIIRIARDLSGKI